MSISMERFESHGQFATYDPCSAAISRISIFAVQCHNCGFEPQNIVTPPRVCPKCRGESWERYAKPGSILKNADRW